MFELEVETSHRVIAFCRCEGSVKVQLVQGLPARVTEQSERAVPVSTMRTPPSHAWHHEERRRKSADEPRTQASEDKGSAFSQYCKRLPLLYLHCSTRSETCGREIDALLKLLDRSKTWASEIPYRYTPRQHNVFSRQSPPIDRSPPAGG